jgi:hypothetical protein
MNPAVTWLLQTPDFLHAGIQALAPSLSKCLTVGGNHVAVWGGAWLPTWRSGVEHGYPRGGLGWSMATHVAVWGGAWLPTLRSGVEHGYPRAMFTSVTTDLLASACYHVLQNFLLCSYEFKYLSNVKSVRTPNTLTFFIIRFWWDSSHLLRLPLQVISHSPPQRLSSTSSTPGTGWNVNLTFNVSLKKEKLAHNCTQTPYLG